MQIPKIFHQIWLGGQVMPECFLNYRASWLRHHPDWDHRLWTEKDLPPSKFPQLLQRSCHLSQRSNIHRYELLLAFGGVYVDTDFEACENIEPLIEDCDAFVGETRKVFGDPVYNPAIMGCVPGHPLLAELVDYLPTQNAAQSKSLGSRYLTHFVRRFPSVKRFPPEIFYPYDTSAMIAKQPRNAAEFPTAWAVHHWSSQWWDPSFRRIVS